MQDYVARPEQLAILESMAAVRARFLFRRLDSRRDGKSARAWVR